MLSLTYRADGCILNMLRRMKIRLPDAKRKNIAPFAYQSVDFGQNDEGIFSAEALCTLADDGHEIFLLI